MGARGCVIRLLVLGATSGCLAPPPEPRPPPPVDAAQAPAAVQAEVGAEVASAAERGSKQCGPEDWADEESGPDARRLRLTDDSMGEWVAARMAAAKRGTPELVRIPLVHRADGWGCVCPSFYIGDDPDMEQGPWLAPSFARGSGRLGVGKVAFAEGFFGPARKRAWYPDKRHPRGGWGYSVIPFRVEKLGSSGDWFGDYGDVHLELLGRPRDDQKGGKKAGR